MRFREILRFELAYQLRRPWPWLAFGVLLVFAYENTRAGIMPVTLPQDFILNSPFIIASVTVFSSLIWLLVASALAGEAAARDVQTGMQPLVFTTPITRAEYLGGRFAAAFLLNALVLLAVQAGSMLGVYAGGVDPDIIGPFRPAAYVAAYAFIALPNAFVAATFQFAAALWSGRSMAGYFGSVTLLFFTVPVPLLLYFAAGRPELALLMDPIGMFAIMNEMMANWTLAEKNVRMFTLDGAMLRNRLLWLGISSAVLTAIYLRFRFAHHTATDLWSRLALRLTGRVPVPDTVGAASVPVIAPTTPATFGPATRVLQALAVARVSFRMIATSPAGLFLLVVYPAFVGLVLVVESQHWGVPLLPRTGYNVPKHVAASLTHFTDYRIIVPVLLVYLAGDLVWRERDARVSEYADATPVQDWVLLLGRFLGLGLVVVALMAVLAAAVAASQLVLGYHDFQPGLSFVLLFGLQLPEYLLFAMLVLSTQAVVNHRHVGMLVALVAWFLMLFASYLGVEHNLLVYGAGPAWSYTDMRGFGASLAPWLWFRIYWASWALLLAVVARLLWVRGRETGVPARLRLAWSRFSGGTARATAVGAALVVGVGGFIFYNTNVLNEYVPDGEIVKRRAEYEHRYGYFEGVPQPTIVHTQLHVEIHPDRGAADIRGTYRLVNAHANAIDSVHVEPAFYVESSITFDRGSQLVVADERLGHFIYALDEPLQPGDSLTLAFELRLEPRGFGNDGRARGVLANGTHFTGGALPLIGYQQRRELTNPDERRRHDLPRQVTLPAPDDVNPELTAGEAGTFDAVIGTASDQVAVAPGELRRTWVEGERRYFHYVSDVPIGGEHMFFSANYVLHREQWNGVEIQVFLHPGHTANLHRLLRSARASLDYYTSHFGPYPLRFLQFVEQPGSFLGMGVDGSGVVTGGEGFFLLNPSEGDADLPFEVVAHEVAHQWWGAQLRPAFAEGGILLSESLAWYSAMRVVRQEQGDDALRRLRARMRDPYPWPPIRTGLPLLRAMDPWAGYRKGPFAFHALAEHIGEDRVNEALSALLRSSDGTLATTLDLYAGLQAVTPDTLQYLLRDLFETNTFWDLATEQVTALPMADGSWQVDLDVRARKTVADTLGRETEVAMDEWIEIGVFAPVDGGRPPPPLYLRKHRIRSGRQTITVVVQERPARAGIDPDILLIDLEPEDNVREVAILQAARAGVNRRD